MQCIFMGNITFEEIATKALEKKYKQCITYNFKVLEAT